MTAVTNYGQKKTEIEKEISTLNMLHAILAAAVLLMYIALFSYKWELSNVLMSLTIFEFVMTISYGFGNRFLNVVHFQYQAILFCVPCFILAVVVINEFSSEEVIAFLDSFNLELIGCFVKRRPVIKSVFIFTFWTLRLLLSHVSLVDVNTKHRLESYENLNLGEIKQSSSHSALNFSAVALFTILAHFNVSTLHQIYLGMAIFELLMSFSYVVKNSWIMLMHFLFQSIVFSVLLFVNFMTIFHRFKPATCSEFLNSYGLFQVSNFVQNGSVFAISILSTAWFLRMMTSHVFLIEVATDAQIHRQQTDRRNQRASQIV